MDKEIFAKLATIEQLLMVLLSDPKYGEQMRHARDNVYREYGEKLNKLFPSDPEYVFYQSVQANFDFVADMIDIAHQFSGKP